MKILSIILLFITFQSTAMAEKGLVVNILPDKLTLSIDCEAQVKLQLLKTEPKKFSVGYSCKNSTNGSYYMDFRLNDIDIVADFDDGLAKVDVNKTKFKSYTLYELFIESEKGEKLKFVSYCTKDVCLDLVGNYEKEVKDSITSQLRG
jgi:hypothetical protein